MPYALFMSLTVFTYTLLLNGCGGCWKNVDRQPTADDAEQSLTDPEVVEVAEVVAPKNTTTAVLFQVEDEIVCWLESGFATLAVNVETGWMAPNALITGIPGGYSYFLSDGHTTYNTTAEPSGEIIPLSELLTRETTPPPGYEFVVSVARNGYHRIVVHSPNDTRGDRLGIYPLPPSSPTWLELLPPQHTHSASDRLLKADAWQKDEQGHYENTGPLGSNLTPLHEISPTTRNLWQSELTSIRGAEVTIISAQGYNLDPDDETEGVICLTGGFGPNCYVVDTVDGQNHYYPTSLRWTPDQQDRLPTVFSTSTGTYIMHVPPQSKDSAAIQVTRFNGVGFVTDRLD